MTLIVGSSELLERVKPLWYRLQEHHLAMFPDVSGEAQFLIADFDRRKRALHACEHLRVTLAVMNDQDVGYGIGSIHHTEFVREHQGEYL